MIVLVLLVILFIKFSFEFFVNFEEIFVFYKKSNIDFLIEYMIMLWIDYRLIFFIFWIFYKELGKFLDIFF